MITKEDISVLDTYFKGLTTVPEELTKLASKVDLMNEIQVANDSLMELMKDGE
jgi:hypothetical protein